ncbi:MAG: UDP-N-acetylmuramoyl-L-alanyl-D-glutamate--2,6-diaminopimelate ligase [Christensenellales bacterium]|jgi:UDP-N-acetylmuramoyl-L-alanyl-D-glutamate--2,6-diaminopimelate ligase
MEIAAIMNEFGKYVVHGNKQADILGLAYDSRRVSPGDLFFCIPGYKVDGHDFAKQAVAAGAVAVVVEHWLPLPDEVAQIVVKDARRAMAVTAANFYGNPARQMTMIGVTGTNGKTTTTYMLKAIGEHIGKKVGLVGTIHNMIGDTPIQTEHTTPESVDLQRLLAEMRDEGVDWVVMEVSSHALELKRVYSMEFDVGIFTNMTQDHLDFHKTFEQYRLAKKKLFTMSRKAVVNADDETSHFMVEDFAGELVSYGIREEALVQARDIEIHSRGVDYVLCYPGGQKKVELQIPGIFSVYNSLSAASAAYVLGVAPQEIAEALKGVSSVAGRFEVLDIGQRDYTVILDYAHSPDGLANILKTAKEFACKRIVTLFGCGGDRDSGKRSIMGEIAGRYSDFCVVTSDNPRTEDPGEIICSIEEGLKKTSCPYVAILNRREAIAYVLKQARKDDIIILAGKGHEIYQEIDGVKYPFNEKEIVQDILASLDQDGKS